MKTTPFLNLLKPDESHIINIDHFNQNANIIDNAFSNIRGDYMEEIEKIKGYSDTGDAELKKYIEDVERGYLSKHNEMKKYVDGEVYSLDKKILNFRSQLDREDQKLDDKITKLKNTKADVYHIKKIYITPSGWRSSGGRFVYDYMDDRINNKTTVNVAFSVDSLQNTRYILPVSESFTGYVRLYAKHKPAVGLYCDMTLIKGVL